MGTKTQTAPLEQPTTCIARQPILSANETVVGYELFFREGREDCRFSSDGENAPAATIETLNLVGLEVLCDGRLAFIKCSRESVLTESFEVLPPDDVVVEIQASVPDGDVVQHARG